MKRNPKDTMNNTLVFRRLLLKKCELLCQHLRTRATRTLKIVNLANKMIMGNAVIHTVCNVGEIGKDNIVASWQND